MSVVAALVPHPARLLRLRVALRGRYTIHACGDWAAVTLLCEEQPVQLAVIDLFAFGPMSLAPLRRLKRRFPRLTTIAYVVASPDRAHDLFDAARAGVDALVVAERDDAPEPLAAIVERARARSVAARLRRALADVRPTARDAVLVTVTRAHEQLTSAALAATLSVSRRVLAKHLGQSGLPSPQRLITWGRLIVAADLLENPNRSADRVAHALHFPSGSAFRNACQRYLHLTPSEIRARGGADLVIAALLAAERAGVASTRLPAAGSRPAAGDPPGGGVADDARTHDGDPHGDHDADGALDVEGDVAAD